MNFPRRTAFASSHTFCKVMFAFVICRGIFYFFDFIVDSFFFLSSTCQVTPNSQWLMTANVYLLFALCVNYGSVVSALLNPLLSGTKDDGIGQCMGQCQAHDRGKRAELHDKSFLVEIS